MKNVDGYLRKSGMSLRKGNNSPLTNNYRPACEVTIELNKTDPSYYSSLIGILRWMVEMGQFEITCEVSMMSIYASMPREGKLQQLYHILAYLKLHHNSRLVLDPTYLEIHNSDFERKG